MEVNLINWVLVPQQFVNGFLNGGTLALIALGIVLIYKSSEVFNFAQGQMVMIGAYMTWFFSVGMWDGEQGMPLWLAILLASGVAVLLGLAIERFALRPMTGQPLLSIVLMTLGLAQLMDGVVTLFFGTQPKSNFPSPFAPTDVLIIPFQGAGLNDEIRVTYARIATFVVAVLAAGLLILFFNKTRTGLSMRATSENHELAQSVGIRISRVFGLSWAIAGIIAALGGVLLATLSGVSINIATVALIAFPAILLGGLESFPGAIVGGIAVGLVQALVQASGVPEIRQSAEIAPYILLLIVLVIRPEGLFGQKRIERI